MDAAKPDTVTLQEQALLEDVQRGSDKMASAARRELSSGVTVAVQQATGEVIYFSDLSAFDEWLAARRDS